MIRNLKKQSGVTIVEILIALFVLASGIVILVKFQGDLLQSRGIVGQRAEAVKLAENKVEQLRHYITIASVGGTPLAYDDIANGSENATGVSATYTITWAVTENASPPYKLVVVTVSWTDPAGAAQSVTLNTIIGKVDPAASGTIMQGL